MSHLENAKNFDCPAFYYSYISTRTYYKTITLAKHILKHCLNIPTSSPQYASALNSISHQIGQLTREMVKSGRITHYNSKTYKTTPD